LYINSLQHYEEDEHGTDYKYSTFKIKTAYEFPLPNLNEMYYGAFSELLR